MYETLSNIVYTRLQSLIGVSSLSQHEKRDLQVFPAISIMEGPTETNIMDVSSYEFITKINVRVIDSAKDNEDTCANMRNLVDRVIAKLLEDPSYGMQVARTDLSATWGWTEADIPARVCDIQLSFTKCVLI